MNVQKLGKPMFSLWLILWQAINCWTVK